MLTIFILNTLMPWRTVALVCSAVPVITAISVYFVSEIRHLIRILSHSSVILTHSYCQCFFSVFFLSDSRNATMVAIKKSNDWAPRHQIAQEFDDLQRHSERSKSCNLCTKQNVPCSHPLPTMREKFAELKRKQTLKPFAIVMGLFFFGTIFRFFLPCVRL